MGRKEKPIARIYANSSPDEVPGSKRSHVIILPSNGRLVASKNDILRVQS